MLNRAPVLFLNVLVIATCGLIYELLAGTLASYLLGDSVTQFSLIIGLYLFAMGIGSWLSRFVETELARCFVEIEIGVALLGGLSAPILFLSFARVSHFQAVLYPLVTGIGALVGLEIPLLMRILKDELDFKELVSRVLAFDYLGALVASLLFPLLFVPKLGLVRTSLLFGILNAVVALWATWLLRPLIANVNPMRIRALIVITILLIAFAKADRLTSRAEEDQFGEKIVHAVSSPYQRIVLTRGRTGFNLFLNSHHQFNSTDEYRYHEALVHPAMLVSDKPRRVLILGGGDGLALREVLKHGSVEHVTLVDLDSEMTSLAKTFAPLAELNLFAFDDPRVKVVNQDAMIWVEQTADRFDTAIIDFPDPNNFALGKLYSTRFFHLLKSRLTPTAAVGIQCTSPLASRRSYWCIVRTMEASGFIVKPYQTAVPSFGIWGFALAGLQPFEPPQRSLVGLRFLDDITLTGLFKLPNDISPVEVGINRLDNQILVRYYESELQR